MNRSDKKLLTENGRRQLVDKLKKLKERRPKMVERMERARQMGDLSENSEYHSAKEDLVFLENQIDDLKETLANAEVVKGSKGKKEINLGHSVTVKQDGNKITYKLVGEQESDPMKKKISYSSPLGQVLMGKKKGETVIAKTPQGEVEYEIVAIK